MTLRERFEAYYMRRHPDTAKRAEVWFQRDDLLWGEAGYAQPVVHFEWLAYRAGYMAGRRK